MKPARKAARPGAYGLGRKGGTGPHREDEAVDCLGDGAAEHAHARAAGKSREYLGTRDGKMARPSEAIPAARLRERAEGLNDVALVCAVACGHVR